MANNPSSFLKSIGATTLTADASLVTKSETTSSTSFVDLATPGPSITLTTGTSVLILIAVNAYLTVLGGSAVVSIDVSGATTIAATSFPFAESGSSLAGYAFPVTRYILVTGLNPGSNTFTLKYKATSGTAGFYNRSIFGMVLGN